MRIYKQKEMLERFELAILFSTGMRLQAGTWTVIPIIEIDR